MKKPEKATCKNIGCANVFLKYSKRKIFCSTKCKKRDFYRRMKENEEANKKYPIYHCPKCNTSVQLDFDPAKRWSPWLKFKCPNCGILMISVCDEIETGDEVMV